MKEHRGILVTVFHADHGVSDDHLAWALDQIHAMGRKGFFLANFELPDELSSLSCGLYGPIMGDPPVTDDEVEMVRRSADRPPSRMVARPPRPDRRMSIIGIMGDEEIKIFTAYGGPIAPREPGDTSLETDAEREEASAFWAQHALSK